jgi:hypothetical protein
MAAEGGLMAAMASAAFTSLCSQTAVSLINNQGDLGKVVKNLSTSQALVSLMTSVAGAGITNQIGVSGANSIGDHVQNAAVQNIAPTTVSLLKNPNLKKALKQGLLDIAVTAAGSYGARQIGNLYHPTDSKAIPINWLEHKFLHGLLGATMGVALSKDRAMGAISGGAGAVLSESIAEWITPSSEELYKGILQDAQSRNLPLSKDGIQNAFNTSIQMRADIARLTTASLLLFTKQDVGIGDITVPAVEIFWLKADRRAV